MIGDKTYPWAVEQASGTLRYKQLWGVRFGYTETFKKVAAANTTAVLAATATVVAGRVVTSGITNPDVPRALSITTGGTTANIAAGDVVIVGTNVEGKVISELFTMSDNLNGTVNGTKAFKTVTSITFPAADGTAATIAVGYLNKLGVNHRLIPGQTTVKVLQDTSVGVPAPVYQAAPTVVADAEEVENNLVTPATNPDGTTFLTIAYTYDTFQKYPTNDEPVYATSTSTSSSTSTSTTTSASTTTSTSSTSSSTSSTSSSTSSTSTSTTTVA